MKPFPDRPGMRVPGTLLMFLISLLTPFTTTNAQPRGDNDCPGVGNCFFSNGSPGCEDTECCQLVCDEDPFCCGNSPQGGGGFWDDFCAGTADELCEGDPGDFCVPSCNKTNVECLVGTPPSQRSSPVGMLADDKGGGFCTAWIIAAPNIALTNEHCTRFGSFEGSQVIFNFECDDCADGVTKETDSYTVVDLIFANADLDYALIRLEGDPASVWGVLPVDAATPIVGLPVYEIHHGDGLAKGFDEGQITSVNVPGNCLSGTDIEVGISAIATGGASGSPVFNANNHCVTICHCGPSCAPGAGVPMSAIWPVALQKILSVGGQIASCIPPQPCSAADGDMNEDGSINGKDIGLFLAAVSGTPTEDEICHGDFSGDSDLNTADVPGMAAALLAGP